MAPLKYITGIDDRLCTLPIPAARKPFYDLYLKQQAVIWNVDEVNFAKDRRDFIELDKSMQKAVKHTLGLFSQFDAIVNEIITDYFDSQVKIKEAGLFMNVQKYIEDIHQIVYAQQLMEIIPDVDEREVFIDSIKNIPSIAQLANVWIAGYKNRSFVDRLVLQMCIEKLMFSSMFAIIYYCSSIGVMAGVCEANGLIARDEGLHVEYYILLYNTLLDDAKLSQKELVAHFDDAVKHIMIFINDMLPESLGVLSAEKMQQYIQHGADGLLAALGYDIYYKSPQPFAFMEQINQKTKGLFFEKLITTYEDKHDAPFSLGDILDTPL